MAKRKYSDGTVVSTSRGDVESSLGAEYEVFLSFRGPDTRQNFADCLYHAMDGAGIRVFRDGEEIGKGEDIGGELKRAIESSSICIPIFSRNYAVSAWCLRELAYMVYRKAMILPVFFDVEPRDVKLKTKLYQDALQKHEEKYGCEVVQRWKEALEKVAGMSGWDLKDTGHGEVSKLIVAKVSMKLNKRDKKLPDHLVGIEDCVDDVMRLIDEGSPDVRYLVIHGMGGIGKTTLAKVVFNQISSRFHRCSFISNVREASNGSKVVQLQKQLLSEILNSNPPEFYDSDAGIYQINTRFRRKKVLIVLDDLDEMDQLSKLAEKPDWFGPGSRIIITTRDTNFLPIEEENQEKNVRTHFKEFTIYQMRELSHRHALELFSKHAFRMDFPPHDYRHISRNIVCKTGGLPLALEVIGSSLCGQSQQLWKATLKKLNLVPNQDVCHKLRISFDMLEDEQKEIFLDIACCFIGEERIHPHYMWKALDFSPKIEIPVLSRMSLIKVDGNDKLSMHDLLRDLGREIVRKEHKFLEERSRLWSPKDALNVVQHRKGTYKITALKLTGLPKEHIFTREEFSSLHNLRLLELEGGNLTGDFKNLLSSLKWLSWHRCPSYLQAVNLCLRNLVVLKLSDSKIPENWNGWGPCLANHDLKVLHLMRCHLSTTPDFSTCSNLRILAFVEHYAELTQIDISIGKLERLKRLEIIAARVQPTTLSGSPHFDLCAIPSTICRFKKLSSLKLVGQCIRELHPSIGEMAGLKCLSLAHCYRLRKVPNSIGKLSSLLELNLFNTRIRELPDSIANLIRLEKMDLGHTRMRELPNSIGRLESLLDLDLQRTDIIALPASIGSLKSLRRLIAIDSKIRELPDSIGDLKRLEEMDLRNTQIRELPNSIGGLESLLWLDLFVTRITELPASIGYLKRLKGINTLGTKIRELPKAIWTLENLEGLVYHGYDSRNIDVTLPPKLSNVFIYCDDPQSLPRLPLGLHYLELIDVKLPIEQPLLFDLRCLHHLRLFRWGLREIEFKQLENLLELDVMNCKSLVRLSGLSSLRKLKILRIFSCSQLIEIRDLGEMESLETLSIIACTSIERLPDLSKLHGLRSLSVNHCESLQGLSDFPNSLEQLLIGEWSSIERLPDLSKLHGLRSLTLYHCKALQGLLAVPNTCGLHVHACPLLGEHSDPSYGCGLCEESIPGQRSRRPGKYM
ncbi:disease resistance protein L6-like isoform X2 [Syzygium oleosum]|uniref:disease resistance protein L6-like isoform X2 n=1 Tax=Syzygium oleosum TaxID=219896 RepID=UPI0024B90D01|nr:disease resistance protein L6-like isoform X2 [Syzygium oleosum]